MANLVNSITIPGNATDLNPGSNANDNRLGGFFSDLYYDRTNNVYYGLVDRGPGGGVIDYKTRVEKFSLNVNLTTGQISGFNLLDTILFKNGSSNYNGLNPLLLNGNASNLGLSQDPEGFAVGPNGNFYVSDEYGPSVNEYAPNGSLIRSFQTPNNLVPRKADNSIDYVSGRPTITTGRQDNRGFEGMALSPDGKKLYGLLQDPLVNEGSSNDGRRSRNLRMVVFDTATGQSTAQYIYQLESITDINARIPGTANDFTATNQGRSIGISAIIPLGGTKFLVLERDNRGVGVDDPLGTINTVGTKRLYTIDISGATDVSSTSLAGTDTLPVGVTPVSKSLSLDIASAIQGAGQKVAEKFEGVAIGPQLSDGTYALIVGTDNDFSVTQSGGGTQFDVVTDGVTSQQIPIGTTPPAGFSLIPTFLYSFKTTPGEITFTPQITPPPLPTPTASTAIPSGNGSLILGNNLNDVINGTTSNDTIYGYAGNDTLNGVNGNDYIDGGIGNDSLIGGADADTFVLGDSINVFYNDNNVSNAGLSDYAVIRDFDSSIDSIRVKGGPTYVVGASPIGSLTGAAIFVNDGAFPELIAVLPGVSPSSAISSRFVSII